jgi:hypothetical protein
MANKVIHVSDALHALVKEYCTRNGLHMSVWAAQALQQTIERRNMGKKKPAGVVVPVEKKRMPQTTGEPVDDGPKPWEREPFWKRGGADSPDESTREDKEKKTPTLPEAQREAQRFDELAGDGQGAQ